MSSSQRIVEQFPDSESLSQAAAREFVTLAGESIAARGQFSVALAGGSTPRRLYQLLAEPPYREQVDWSAVRVFWGDERAVSPEHADSNYRMAREALLDKVPLPATSIHRMPAERADLDAAAWDYQREIARALQIEVDAAPPALDLVLLGLGTDGHTASLFPYTAALAENQRWVAPNYVPHLKAHRMTLTVPCLNQARNVVFLVAGSDKQAVLQEVLEGPQDPQRLPSQLIQPVAGRLSWLIA